LVFPAAQNTGGCLVLEGEEKGFSCSYLTMEENGSYDAHPSLKFYQAVRVHHQVLIPDVIIH